VKLPFEMVVRACVAYNVVVIRHDPAQMAGMRAALEAALGQCEIISFGHSMRDEKLMRYEGKRVALVVLDD